MSLDPKKLKELREEAGLSAGKLSLRAGLSRQAVSRLEKGTRGRSPRFSTVKALADALGKKPEDITESPPDWRFG